jgi:glycosyltransferase involved in cell wall biosynthesis
MRFVPLVIAIVPAHDEATRIAPVIHALLASRQFTRVLVVDDGSTDGTAEVARAAGAQVLRLSPNGGKGSAMLAGLRSTNEPIVAFFDADLVGLRPDHVRALVEPVVSGRAGMTVGLRDHGKWNLAQMALPPITGERVVLRSLLDRVPASFWSGFRIEAGINEVVRRSGMPMESVLLTGLSIVPQWAKTGDVRGGIEGAARMLVQVLTAMRDARDMP